MKAIVLYDSKHGTTRLAAESIASGIGAERALSLAELGSGPTAHKHLEGVDLVVLGAPFYFGQWSKRAVAFLREAAAPAAAARLAVFTVGTGPDEAVRNASVLAAAGGTLPSLIAHLGGRFEGLKLNLLERAMVRMVSKSGSPVRRYDAAEAEAFAKQVKEILK
jgi:menaquinone-dependent protoporphyrinogen IX oxidase